MVWADVREVPLVEEWAGRWGRAWGLVWWAEVRAGMWARWWELKNPDERVRERERE